MGYGYTQLGRDRTLSKKLIFSTLNEDHEASYELLSVVILPAVPPPCRHPPPKANEREKGNRPRGL